MKPGAKVAIGAGAAVALAAAAVLAFLALPGDPTAPDAAAGAPAGIALTPGDAAAVARGREIYAAECAACHGTELEGEPDWRRRLPSGRLPAPPHDESGHTWHHPDEALFRITKLGPAALVGDGYESDMPGYDGVLTDRQILDVLSYIKSTWAEEIQARHDEINRHAANAE